MFYNYIILIFVKNVCKYNLDIALHIYSILLHTNSFLKCHVHYIINNGKTVSCNGLAYNEFCVINTNEFSQINAEPSLKPYNYYSKTNAPLYSVTIPSRNSSFAHSTLEVIMIYLLSRKGALRYMPVELLYNMCFRMNDKKFGTIQLLCEWPLVGLFSHKERHNISWTKMFDLK